MEERRELSKLGTHLALTYGMFAWRIYPVIRAELDPDVDVNVDALPPLPFSLFRRFDVFLKPAARPVHYIELIVDWESVMESATYQGSNPDSGATVDLLGAPLYAYSVKVCAARHEDQEIRSVKWDSPISLALNEAYSLPIAQVEVNTERWETEARTHWSKSLIWTSEELDELVATLAGYGWMQNGPTWPTAHCTAEGRGDHQGDVRSCIFDGDGAPLVDLAVRSGKGPSVDAVVEASESDSVFSDDIEPVSSEHSFESSDNYPLSPLTTGHAFEFERPPEVGFNLDIEEPRDPVEPPPLSLVDSPVLVTSDAGLLHHSLDDSALSKDDSSDSEAMSPCDTARLVEPAESHIDSDSHARVVVPVFTDDVVEEVSDVDVDVHGVIDEARGTPNASPVDVLIHDPASHAGGQHSPVGAHAATDSMAQMHDIVCIDEVVASFDSISEVSSQSAIEALVMDDPREPASQVDQTLNGPQASADVCSLELQLDDAPTNASEVLKAISVPVCDAHQPESLMLTILEDRESPIVSTSNSLVSCESAEVQQFVTQTVTPIEPTAEVPSIVVDIPGQDASDTLIKTQERDAKLDEDTQPSSTEQMSTEPISPISHGDADVNAVRDLSDSSDTHEDSQVENLDDVAQETLPSVDDAGWVPEFSAPSRTTSVSDFAFLTPTADESSACNATACSYSSPSLIRTRLDASHEKEEASLHGKHPRSGLTQSVCLAVSSAAAFPNLELNIHSVPDAPATPPSDETFSESIVSLSQASSTSSLSSSAPEFVPNRASHPMRHPADPTGPSSSSLCAPSPQSPVTAASTPW
ncbi:hypothetical protein C8Q80DRAFT_1267827 [Daedaleopsis nitida]|nr:hypothetical protein C8Q80DRAFT_1267827 [Daedaleopsis nitida]